MKATIPADRDSERSVISGIAGSSDLWRYAEHLTPDHFFDIQAREAFIAMNGLVKDGRLWIDEDPRLPDWVFMGRIGITSFQLEELVKRLEEAHICRSAFLQSSEIVKAALSMDVHRVESTVTDLKLPNRSGAGTPASLIASELFDRLGEDMNSDIVPLGFGTLDRAGVGRRKEALGVCARPSMGKSQLVFQIAGNVAEWGVSVLASLEMSGDKAIARIAGARAGVAYREATDQTKQTLMAQALAWAFGLERLIVFDDPMSSMELWGHCRRIADQHGRIDLVVVDHIRFMTDEHEAERHRLGQIVANLRSLSKELNCLVMPCVQLSRASEQRANKRPGLSDLRDSGEIEENLDVAAFLYRDRYYEARNDGGSQSGEAEFYAGKNRDGRLWGTRLYFDAEHGPRFAELERNR